MRRGRVDMSSGGSGYEHVQIGLAGWGDHESVYPAGTSAGRKLSLYAKQFPIVEVDSSFYAIPSVETVQRWVDETPDDFGFVVKAFQAMTGHDRDSGRRALGQLLVGEAVTSADALRALTPEQESAMFTAFREAFNPMVSAGCER